MIKKERNIGEIIKKHNFFSKSIFNKFNEAKSKWISEAYVYLIDNKIVAFLFMMKENLKCAFLHYHIKDNQKEYFIEKYPLVKAEVKTNKGRIDAVIIDKDIYIFEFKFDGDKDQALNQIKDKKYFEKYQGVGKEIYLFGVEFTDRNIGNWVIEKL